MKESELRELKVLAKEVVSDYPGMFSLDGRDNLHNDLGGCVPTSELLYRIETCRAKLYQLCDRVSQIPSRKPSKPV